LVVCADHQARDAVVLEFEAAGWHTEAGLGTPGTPPDPGGIRVADLEDPEDLAALAALLSSGRSAVVTATSSRLAADAYDQCRRLALAEWYDAEHRPFADGMESVHLLLLERIGRGDGVAAAARHANVSGRTAARRIADARRLSGSRTNREAAVRLLSRLEALRPTPAA
jgi:hypothetical protein